MLIQYGQTGISGSQFVGSANTETIQNTTEGDKGTLMNTGTDLPVFTGIFLIIIAISLLVYYMKRRKK